MDLIEIKDNINRHPWELSRTSQIIKEIKKLTNIKSVLDIGCGDSYFDKELINSINIKELYALDINLKEIKQEENIYYINNYKSIKNKKFDLIIMMDVLEHIKEDSLFIKENVLPYLKDNGKILITVPAHQSLYGQHDKKLLHYRRYSKKELIKVINNNNLKINNIYYFYFLLFIIRLFNKNNSNDINTWKYNSNNIKTKIIKNMLNIDYYLCKKLSKISNGLSIYALLERNK